MLPFYHRRQVENETYRMIDTIFLKSRFLPKNPHFTQCSCGFRDFSKIAFFDPPKNLFFPAPYISMSA